MLHSDACPLSRFERWFLYGCVAGIVVVSVLLLRMDREWWDPDTPDNIHWEALVKTAIRKLGESDREGYPNQSHNFNPKSPTVYGDLFLFESILFVLPGAVCLYYFWGKIYGSPNGRWAWLWFGFTIISMIAISYGSYVLLEGY